MRDRARYVKIVEWSDEDQCFVGSCQGLFYGGCHGDNGQVVLAELCEIVKETSVVVSSLILVYALLLRPRCSPRSGWRLWVAGRLPAPI